jgi:hypothetical protein
MLLDSVDDVRPKFLWNFLRFKLIAF